MKFSGKLGFAISEEIRPGVWTDINITEKSAVGDIVSFDFKQENPTDAILDLNINSRISIVIDSYIKSHIGAIKYVEYLGTKWVVKTASVQYPRLILTLGGIYNG